LRGDFQPIHSLWNGCGLEPGGCWSDGGPLGVAGWLTPSINWALLAHVALEADVAGALPKRGCRLACFGTQHCALLIVPPIVSSATPTLEAPVFWRTSVSHAAWDVPTVHGAHAVYRVSKLGTARGNRLEGCVKRRLLHERAGAQPIRQGTPAIPRRETCAQSAAGSHFCRLTTRNGADGRDLHSLQWIFGGAGRTRSP
jgi:hypothetical protein